VVAPGSKDTNEEVTKHSICHGFLIFNHFVKQSYSQEGEQLDNDDQKNREIEHKVLIILVITIGFLVVQCPQEINEKEDEKTKVNQQMNVNRSLRFNTSVVGITA